MVTVSCWAGAGALVTLEGISAAVPGQPAELQLNVTENDDKRGFFCDAALDVGGETLRKNQSAELRVLCEWVPTLPLPPPRTVSATPSLTFLCPLRLMPADSPRLDDSDCPRSWTWPEGPEQTLRCEARGNPEPSVHCARPDSGAVLALGLLGPVTRALAGTYRCRAVNGQGQAVKDVTLTVECE